MINPSDLQTKLKNQKKKTSQVGSSVIKGLHHLFTPQELVSLHYKDGLKKENQQLLARVITCFLTLELSIVSQPKF
jgi:hypothetical protein